MRKSNMRPIPKTSSTNVEEIDSRLRAFLERNDIPTAVRMSNLINYFREPALREAEFGLTRPEVGILLFLNVSEGITAAEFCEFSGQLKAGVSRAVILLEEKGLIRRETDTSDNRRQRLFMKDAGRKLYKATRWSLCSPVSRGSIDATGIGQGASVLAGVLVRYYRCFVHGNNPCCTAYRLENE